MIDINPNDSRRSSLSVDLDIVNGVKVREGVVEGLFGFFGNLESMRTLNCKGYTGISLHSKRVTENG